MMVPTPSRLGKAYIHVKNVCGCRLLRLLASCSGLFLSSPALSVVFILPLPLSFPLCICLCLRPATLLLHASPVIVFSNLRDTKVRHSMLVNRACANKPLSTG